MDLLFLYGLPDNGKCFVKIGDNGHFQSVGTGASNVAPFLKHLPVNHHAFCLDGNGSTQNCKFDYHPNLIFNEISDPDSHAMALKRAVDLCKALDRPVFNKPEAMQQTRRDHIYENLHQLDGLRVPKTIRFEARSPIEVRDAIRDGELQYPVIFRKSGDHGGISTSLIKDEAGIEETLYAYALDGTPFYATEFVDYVSDDGNYRKYRIVVIEGKPHLRHLIIGDDWLIHSSSREYMSQHPNLQQEETELLESFEQRYHDDILPTILEITRVLQLDYYGIDCNIDENGKMLVFEINANMNMLINNQPHPNVWEAPIQRMVNHLSQALRRKAGVEKQETTLFSFKDEYQL